MKKRLLSMFLALAMMFSLAVPAYADNEPADGQESEIAALDEQLPTPEPAPEAEPVLQQSEPALAELPDAAYNGEESGGDPIGEPGTYTVVFDANGGYFSAPGDEEYFSDVTAGELITDSPIPSRDDPTLSFTGWNLLASGTGDMVDLATFVPDGDMTLYAMWVGTGGKPDDDPEENCPTLSLGSNSIDFAGGQDVVYSFTPATDGTYLFEAFGEDGGSSPRMESVDGRQVYGNDYPRNGLPHNYCGYELTGGTTYTFRFFDDGAAETVWTVNMVDTYVVIVNANGGYIHGNVNENQCGASIPAGAPALPWSVQNQDRTKRLDGWYYDAACTDFAVAKLTDFFPTESTTIYAHWVDISTLHLGDNTIEISGGEGIPYAFTPTVNGYYLFEGSCSELDARPDMGYTSLGSVYCSGQHHEDNSYSMVRVYEMTAGETYIFNFYDESDIANSAVWSISMTDVYTVTFDANGGYFHSDVNITTGSQTVLAGMSTGSWNIQHPNPNMMLDGWYYDENGDNFACSEMYYTPTHDVTLYAHWTECYNVTFDANGGYWWGNPDHTLYVREVMPGDNINDYPTPDQDDDMLSFGGWYLYADGSGESIDPFNYIPTGNMTLYAKWNAPQPLSLGDNSVALEGSNLVYATFTPAESGWYHLETQADGQHPYFSFRNIGGSYSNYEDSNGIYHRSGDVELTGGETYTLDLRDEWGNICTIPLNIRKIVRYNVTLDANGGVYSNELTQHTYPVTQGDSFQLRDLPVNASDSTLAVDAWYYDADCTQLAVASMEDFTPTEDVTLYAHWVTGYLVTFDADGGYFNDDTSLTQITCRVAPGCRVHEIPNRYHTDEHMMCDNRWFFTPNATDNDPWVDVDSYVPTGDVTLYAGFYRSVCITLDANGGYYDDDVTDTIRFLCVGIGRSIYPTRIWNLHHSDAGLTVDGWYRDAACTDFVTSAYDSIRVTEEMTLYAHWAETPTLQMGDNSVAVNGNTHVVYSFTPEETGDYLFTAVGTTTGSEPEVMLLNGYNIYYSDGYDETNHRVKNIAFRLTAGETYSFFFTDRQGYEGDTVWTISPTEVLTVTCYAMGGYFWNDPEETVATVNWLPGDSFSPYYNLSISNQDPSVYADSWYYDADYEALAVSGAERIPITENTTLYAHWITIPAASLGNNIVQVEGGAKVYLTFTPEETRFYSFESHVETDPYFELYGPEGWQIGSDDDAGDDLNFLYTCELTAGATYRIGVTDWDSSYHDLRFSISEAEVYAVTFDANGGSYWDDETQHTMFVEQGNRLNFGDTPMDNDGMYCAGWNTAADGTGSIIETNDSFTPTGDMTVYAVWRPYIVATLGENALQNDGYRHCFTFTPTETDYYMISTASGTGVDLTVYSSDGRWIGNGNGRNAMAFSELEAGQTYQIEIRAGDISYTGSMDITIEKTEICTVTFVSSQGYIYGSEDNTEETRTAPVGRPLRDFPGVYNYPEGFEFDGWSLTEGGEQINYNYVPTGDVTLYARWLETKTLTLDANGGFFDFGDEQREESEFPDLEGRRIYPNGFRSPDHVDPHLVFNGWYYDDDCTQPVDNSFVLTEDITLYAGWADAYLVTLDANGGWFAFTEDEEATFSFPVKIGESAEPGTFIDALYNEDVHLAHTDKWRTPDGDIVTINGFVPEDDVTLYAVWTEAYAVTFDFNGGEIPYGIGGGSSRTISVPTGEAICTVASGVGIPTLYSADGDIIAIFECWYEDADCTQRAYNPFGLIPEGDMTFYAGYVYYHTVTIQYLGNNDWTEDFMVADGDYLSERYDFYIDDYNYNGYRFFLDHDCTIPVNPETYKINDDVTFFRAKLGGESVQIMLDANGGEALDYMVDLSLTYGMGERFENRWQFNCPWEVFGREGYIAIGWTTAPDGTEPIDPETPVTEGMTVYILWNECADITLEGNGTIFNYYYNDRPDNETVVINAPIGDSLLEWLPGELYAFGRRNNDWMVGGWYYDSGCTLPVEEDDIVEGPVTVYAKWTAPIRVIFDANGGQFIYTEVDESTRYLVPGWRVDWTPSLSEPYGTILVGFSLDRAGTQMIDDITEYVPTEDTTIFYQWAPGYRVFLDAGDGLFWGDQSYTWIDRQMGEAVGDEPYGFNDGSDRVIVGWYFDMEHTQPAGDLNELVPNEKITLYAEWGDNCQLTLDANGGYFALPDEPTEHTVTVNAGVETGLNIPVLHHDYMALVGWCTDAACQGEVIDLAGFVPTDDVTLYAKWAAAPKLTLSFDAAGDSFDYYDVVTVHASVVNANGTQEGISDENNSYIITYLTDEWGNSVDGWGRQGQRGLTASAEFPMGNPDLEEGVYKIIAKKALGNTTLYAELPFYYNGYVETERDLEGYTVSLTLEPAQISENETALMTAEVRDANGNLANGVKVSFRFLDENGGEFPEEIMWLYHITHDNGRCSVGCGFIEDEYTPAGRYTIRAILDDCPTITDDKTLTFLGAGTVPGVRVQPVSQTVEPGTDIVFSIEGEGYGLSYQWYYRTGTDDAWKAAGAASAHTANYTITAQTRHDGYQYFCRVKNFNGYVDSNIITLRVGHAPTITTQPSSTAVAPGAAVSFTVAAEGTDLSYQWYYRTSPTGDWTAASAASARTARYALTAQERHDGFEYYCTVSNVYGSVDSEIVLLGVGTVINEENFPDEVFRSYVAENIDTNGNGALSAAECAAVTEIEVCGTNIASLEGIEFFPELRNLNFWSDWEQGTLAAVDLSNNTKIEDLTLGFTAISVLDVSMLPHLRSLMVGFTNLATLDLTHNPELVQLICSDSALTSLDLSGNPALRTLDCCGNPGLTYLDISNNPYLVADYRAGGRQLAWLQDANPEAYQTVRVYGGNGNGGADDHDYNLAISTYTTVFDGAIAPTITVQPTSLTVAPDSEITFTVVAAGTDPSYQWFYRTDANGTWTAASAASARTASYTITAQERHNGYEYYCRVSNDAGSVDTNVVQLLVGTPPVITAQPTSLTVAPNTAITFSVEAEGRNVQYQWFYRTNPQSDWVMAGAVSARTANYAITAQERHNGYEYYCHVSNVIGGVDTEVVQLLVGYAPEIMSQPESVTVDPGTEVTFTVRADGSDLSYQWFYRASAADAWVVLDEASALTASYTMTAQEANNGYEYYCCVSNLIGSVDSESVRLMVGTAPTITVQPTSITVAPDTAITFSVEASGSGQLQYQWYYRTSAAGVWTAAGAASARTPNYTITAQERHNGYEYYCRVSNSIGNAESSVARLLVGRAPEITAQPQSITVEPNTEIQLSITAEGGELNYQWFYRTNPNDSWKAAGAASARTANYTITAQNRHNGYEYYCRVSNSIGRVDSEVVRLTVGTAPVITVQPTSMTVAPGTPITFTVEASGGDDLQYQWYYRTSAVGAWTAPGAASAKTAAYAMTAQERHNGYEYYCIVSNAIGTTDTEIVQLLVGTAPTITVQPEPATVDSNSTLTLSVAAEGSDLHYQWYYRTSATAAWTAAGAASARTANYTITVQERHNGYEYYCHVSNSLGSEDSRVVKLTVGRAPEITTQPESQTVAPNTSVTFSVAAEGSGLAYQWFYRTGANDTWKAAGAASARTANYTITAQERHNGYEYYCRVSNGVGRVDSRTVKLTVGVKPVITSQPTSQAVVPGTAVTFSVTADGVSLSYQWYYRTNANDAWKAAGAASASTPNYSITAQERHNGYEYYCRVSNTTGSVYSDVVRLTVGTAPVITSQPTSQSVAPGTGITFSVEAAGGGLRYQWYYRTNPGDSWKAAGAATASTANYSITAQARHNGYEYYCKISNLFGSVNSETVSLTVG